jgi:hypothetical protein
MLSKAWELSRLVLKNKSLIFALFLVLGLISQFFVLIASDEVLLNWFSSDDAFYYYKTAQNITEGKGITFDGFSPTNGFHPLWMAVCIPVFALARYNLYLPLRVLVLILIGLNAGTGYFIYRIFEKKSVWVGFLSAFSWMYFLPIHVKTTQMGLETGLTAFMLAFFLFQNTRINWDAPRKQIRSQLALTGLVGLGLLLSRLDHIFLLITIGVWNIFHGEKFNRVAQIDFLLLLISAVTSFFIRMQGVANLFEFVNFYFLLIALSLVVRPSVLFLFGAYQASRAKFLVKLIRLIAASVISSVLIFGILWITHDVIKLYNGFPRSVVLFDAGLSFLLIVPHHIFQVTYGQSQSGEDTRESQQTRFKMWIGNAISYFAPIFSGLSLYLLFNHAYAGSAMPVSGEVKRWWGTLPNTVYGRPITTLQNLATELVSANMEKGPFWLFFRPISSVIGWITNLLSQINFLVDHRILMWIIISVLLAIAVYFLFIRERKGISEKLKALPLLPLFVGVFMHALSYKATGYMHVREWYWMGELICILLFFGTIVSYWLRKLAISFGGTRLIDATIGIMCAGILMQFMAAMIRQYPLNGDVPILYNIPAEIELFERHTEPGDVIGMTAAGMSAYFMPDRTIVNLDGLINSADYFDQLQDGDISQYLDAVNVKYIYGNALVFLDSDPYRWFFEGKLDPLGEGEHFIFFKYLSFSPARDPRYSDN